MKKFYVILMILTLLAGLAMFTVSAEEAPAGAPEGAPAQNAQEENDTDFWTFFESGTTLAVLGAFLAVALTGIGSSKGVGMTGRTAAGIVAEEPSLSGKLIILESLPSTQSIYGIIIAFLVMFKIGTFSGGMELSIAEGMYYLLACLPIGVVGLISAIYQGKVASASMQMYVKQKDKYAMAITYPAIVESFAIFALLISMLLIVMH